MNFRQFLNEKAHAVAVKYTRRDLTRWIDDYESAGPDEFKDILKDEGVNPTQISYIVDLVKTAIDDEEY